MERDMAVSITLPTLGFSRWATFEGWHTAGAQTNQADWTAAAE